MFDRYEHNRDERRAALIGAATHIFAREGFGAARTRAIAEEAGCSEGLIHRYFGGKQGLLRAILAVRGEDLVRDLTDELPTAATAHEEIERLLTWQIERMARGREFMSVAIGQALTDPAVGAAIGAGLGERRLAALAQRFRQLQERGLIHPGVDLEAMAEVVSAVGFALGFLQPVLLMREPADLHAMARRVAALLAPALTGDRTQQPTPAGTL